MEFTLEVSPAARRDLKRLPENVQNEILFTHLPAIKDDPYGVGRICGELSKVSVLTTLDENLSIELSTSLRVNSLL